MKRFFRLLALLLISNFSFSQDYQFAIIQDKDGFSNVREEANLKSKIVGTVKNDELIFVFDNEDNKDWFIIETPKINGFIHKSRIKPLTKFKEISPSSQDNSHINFKFDNFKINISTEKFDSKNIQYKEINKVLLKN